MELNSQSDAVESGIGCVLRMYGDEFDVDDLLSKVNLTSCHIRRKGQPMFSSGSKIADRTGFHVVTSDASERNLPQQVEGTIKFLKAHLKDLEYALSYPGLTDSEIDFSVESRIKENNYFTQNNYLPPELLSLAGNLGIGINLTLYPGRKDK